MNMFNWTENLITDGELNFSEEKFLDVKYQKTHESSTVMGPDNIGFWFLDLKITWLTAWNRQKFYDHKRINLSSSQTLYTKVQVKQNQMKQNGGFQSEKRHTHLLYIIKILFAWNIWPTMEWYLIRKAVCFLMLI